MIDLAKHMWIRARHITGFLSTIFFPLAIITFYTTLLKTQLKPPVLSLAPQHLSNQVWYPHSGSSNSKHTFHSYSILSLHFLSSSYHSAVLQFKLLLSGYSTSFSCNDSLNCVQQRAGLPSWNYMTTLKTFSESFVIYIYNLPLYITYIWLHCIVLNHSA